MYGVRGMVEEIHYTDANSDQQLFVGIILADHEYFKEGSTVNIWSCQMVSWCWWLIFGAGMFLLVFDYIFSG